MENTIRVLIIENQALVRAGIRSVLQKQRGIEIVAEVETSNEGFEVFKKTHADVVLISLRLRDSCAVDEIEKFLQFSPKSKIIVLASHAGDAEISRSLQSGAFGYVLKDVSENDLVKAIRTVAAGKKFVPFDVAEILTENLGQENLTPSEQRILQMIVAGKSNKQIAFDLNISENTVKTHVKNLFDKLQVSDRTSAATIAIKRGLVRIDV
ncbi:MAG: response regulator transcription factor [Acidobacteria bacterium]|nr:response regulator transcription factor [Acidobacteriota bacterium]MCA1637982.1 response regulator transcription factor [Acidobacteriota bacterium]